MLRCAYINLEAYCRANSQTTDWGKHTVVGHEMKMVSVSDDGSPIELLCNLKDGVTVRHVITVREDEIDFRLGGLKPGEKLEIKGKVYLVNNDLETLRARYRKDFPEHLSLNGR